MFNFKRKVKIEDLRSAADIVSTILRSLKSCTEPGASLRDLENLVEHQIEDLGATSYNKGYQPSWARSPYPSVICACIDEEAVHAPPAGRILKEGQIVTYDLGIKYKSACGDAAITVPVGKISNRKERLLRHAREALSVGIKEVKAGIPVSHIGAAIERFAILRGYAVVRDYGGHVIGREMHEEPLVPHYNCPKCTQTLDEGTVVCIEPTLVPGQREDARVGIMGEDGWTAFTLSGQPAAMWEDMILIKKDGYEILTTHLKN